MTYNTTLASLLRQIAALLDEQGVAFKPAAYRRAANTIEDLKEDVKKYVARYKTEKEQKKALMELPGIGQAIAEKILEYLKTGRIRHLEELMGVQGGLSSELMMVENLGPKRVRQLQSLGIQNVKDLVRAAKAGKLRNLPRFSELMEKKILGNAKESKKRSRRFSLEEVCDDVQLILRTLKKIPGVERCEAAGSYRREKETVGDIDILIVTSKPAQVATAITNLPIVRTVVAQGPTKVSFDLISGLRVDVRMVNGLQWGSALLYFTGDKEHNIVLRKRAIERGWKLNEYGLFEGAKRIAGREEEDIYKALGLSWIKPNERRGELPEELPF